MALPELTPVASRDDIVAIDSALLRNRVSLQSLVALDIFDAPSYYWSGFGDLVACGQTWQGIGNVIEISEIPMGMAQAASAVSLKLQGKANAAGMGDLLTKVRANPDAVQGREIAVLGALFDPVSTIGTGMIGNPFFLFRSKQGGRVQINSDAGSDGVSHAITLSAESWFSGVRDVAHEYVTDSAVKSRTPGDRGGEHVAQIAIGKDVIWRRD